MLAYFAFRQDQPIVELSAHSYGGVRGKQLQGFYRHAQFVNPMECDDSERQDWVVLVCINKGKRPARIRAVHVSFHRRETPNKVVVEMPLDVVLREDNRGAAVAIAPASLVETSYNFDGIRIVDDAGEFYRLPASAVRPAPSPFF